MNIHSYIHMVVADKIKLFKLLADPTRFFIIRLLIKEPEGLCVGDIAEAIDLSHSAASHQLTRLEDKGILVSERIGQTICYKMSSSPQALLIARLYELKLI